MKKTRKQEETEDLHRKVNERREKLMKCLLMFPEVKDVYFNYEYAVKNLHSAEVKEAASKARRSERRKLKKIAVL